MTKWSSIELTMYAGIMPKTTALDQLDKQESISSIGLNISGRPESDKNTMTCENMQKNTDHALQPINYYVGRLVLCR